MSLCELLNEVVRLKQIGKQTTLLSMERKKPKPSPRLTRPIIPSTMYNLGSPYTDLYFTKREAECMVLLLRGKTIGAVAAVLQLSPRTVEYYVKNMKSKLRCRTKFELLDIVHSSSFAKSSAKMFPYLHQLDNAPVDSSMNSPPAKSPDST